MTIEEAVVSWPVIRPHAADDGTPCFWGGVQSEAGEDACPDGCRSLAGEARE